MLALRLGTGVQERRKREFPLPQGLALPGHKVVSGFLPLVVLFCTRPCPFTVFWSELLAIGAGRNPELRQLPIAHGRV